MKCGQMGNYFDQQKISKLWSEKKVKEIVILSQISSFVVFLAVNFRKFSQKIK